MKVKKVPERRCIACMKLAPKSELLRIVATDTGVKVDLGGKMNGRGAYICRSMSCLELALKKNALSRNLKKEMSREQVLALAEELAEILK